ncbi:MAG: NADH-quinone oxidoreductase subunit M [Planctomycetota bacterium]|nr:NADH-quinone oxidoreductase subunit M [Planctomycetota bacterium]
METFNLDLPSSILAWITFIPMIGMAAIMFVPKTNMTLVKGITYVATFIPFVLASVVYWGYDKGHSGYQYAQEASWISINNFNVFWRVGVDGLSLPLVWLTTILLFLAVPASETVPRVSKAYFALLLMLEVGILGVFISLDYFLFYVFWEVMLLPMYFLIGIWGGPKREYAAIKFFLYTLAGSVLMLVALVALYLNQPDGMETFSIPAMMAIGGAQGWAAGPELLGMQFTTWVFWFLFIGFAIKIPCFPFHTWLPDAHVQAPTPISVILAGILLKLGGYGLIRGCFPIVPDAFRDNAYILGVLGVISIVYGAYVALGQTDFKRMVAYSSVSHMGFVLLGMAALTEWGMNGAALQMFNHGTSSAACFLVVGVIYDRAHHRDLNAFGGVAQPMPRYWALATIAFFASLGLPGMAGFVSEAMTLVGSFQSPDPRFRILVLIAALGVVLTGAYILWALQRVFLGPLNEKYKDYEDITGREIFSLAPLLFLCVFLGIFPYYLLDWMDVGVIDLMKLLSPGS